MRTHHWFDFYTSLVYRGRKIRVKVEATISSGSTGVEIEGVKVKLLSGTELVPSNEQMHDIRNEILDRCM